ncbi:MAG: VWA domain-containing protein [Candidatus Freyarchaeota archaeon]|nr:VWA domain-containing protein [Candidatus Freyrarchaeum guaymaensis]
MPDKGAEEQKEKEVKPLKAVKKTVKKKRAEAAEEKAVEEKKGEEEEVIERMFKEAEEAKEEKPPKKQFKVVVKEGLSGYISLNEKDASELQILEGSIVEFEDPLSGAGGVALAHLDKDVPPGTAVMEPALSEACGIDEGFEVNIGKFEGTPQKITKIVFGVEPLEGGAEEAIRRVLDAKDEFQNWLDGRVIFKDWVLKFPKLNVNVYVVSTEPPLTGRQVGIINFAEIKSYEVKPWRAAVPFNAILLIDVSRSMLTEDMKVMNIAPAIEAIKTIGGEIPEIKEFLEQFQEGKNVKRVAGAVFAALLYLVEKVGRGYGERVAIITYSETAEPITFLMTGGVKLPYFHPGKSKMAGVSQLGRLIIDRLNRVSSSHTNMSEALMEALKLIETWEKEEPEGKRLPNMIVLLSDGFPDIWGDEGPPVQVVHDHFSKRSDVVIYTVGIGGEVQERIMEAIATKGHGIYYKAEDLGDLLNWYQKLARDLVIRLEA